ncbi:MAG: hypothetical protein D3923_06585 [Candidatus Electrothrix sp. AR3]|nr:hypothetical protein [Candidatus Electrothrix sp. AR3]
MEKLIAALKEIIQFKENTDIGDIVLIAAVDPQMTAYALVTGIERDSSRKDEWWQVSMQLLAVPLQPLVWTLRTEQFTGQEIFTMGGKARFVKAIRIEQASTKPTSQPMTQEGKGGLRIVK